VAVTPPSLTAHPVAGPPDGVLGLDRGLVVPVAGGDGSLYELPDQVQARPGGLRERIEGLQRQRSGRKKYGRAWRSLSMQIKRAHAEAANITDNWAGRPRNRSSPPTR
jgi:hypothetical protein